MIKLGKKLLKNGGYSLYADINHNGIRRKEYLGLYLLPGKDASSREQNRETLHLAELRLAGFTLAQQRRRAGMTPRDGEAVRLTDYIKEYIDTHDISTGYKKTLLSVIKYCQGYKSNVSLAEVDKYYLLGLMAYMKGKVKPSTVNKYINLIGTILNKAYKDGLVNENACKRLDNLERPRTQKSERPYLDMEEVKLLADAECPDPSLKDAFLFSCFTGLRLSDVKGLTWEEIAKSRITRRMQKTQEVVYLPLSDNALKFLPENRGNGSVFSFKSFRQMSRDLTEWAENAGITKHLTFHVARHTFATLALTYGADIYTVSGLLGHKNVATTQIYAKIVDKKKEKAVKLIPTL